MAKLMFLSFFLLVLGQFSSSKILPRATTEYTAAAFEHKPYFVFDGLPPSRHEALRRMKMNTQVYNEQARSASKRGAQIIVFPEDGIYGIFHTRNEIQPYLEPIPDVSESSEPWVPCTDPNKVANTEILQNLSCIALNNKIALVANMGDIKYCTDTDPNCPPDGRYQFNTDVVFDTDGRLLAKYHKEHLVRKETQFNTPSECEFVTFVTSFNVRFGVFTCFDLLFKSPAVDLVQKYGVRNIVFPTAWFHGYPLLNSIQYQQAWSRTNCVNFIAANLFMPILGFTGSGIYACGQAKTYTSGTESTKARLLISTLKDFKEDSQITRILKPLHSQAIAEQTHQTVKVKQGKYSYPQATKTFKARLVHNMYTLTKLIATEEHLSVCADKMCCNLDYKLQDATNLTESFALGTFRGNDALDGYFLEVCVIFKCLSNVDQSCGKEVDTSETVFRSFRLRGNFSSKAAVYPGVLSSGVKLSQPDVVKFTGDTITSEHFEQALSTAVLLGRVYSKDKPRPHITVNI